jgi:hypothetical protein
VHLRIAGEPGGQHVPYPLSLHPAGPVQVLPVGFAVKLVFAGVPNKGTCRLRT